MKIAPTILLFLLAIHLPAALGEVAEPATSRPQGSQSRFAALDDVRSLANGLLHLGQSLREFVDNTRSQINNIFQKLNIFDHSFYQLSLLASEIKEEEEELKKTTVALQANNEEIKDLSAQINSRVDNILLEKSSMQDKLQVLEEKLSSLSQGLTTSKHAAEIIGLRVSNMLFTAIGHTLTNCIVKCLSMIQIPSILTAAYFALRIQFPIKTFFDLPHV